MPECERRETAWISRHVTIAHVAEISINDTSAIEQGMRRKAAEFQHFRGELYVKS